MLYNNDAFYKRLKRLCRPIKVGDINQDTKLLIDASCILHALFGGAKGFAVRLLELHPGNVTAVKKYTQDLADAMVEYMASLDLPTNRYLWVFEGAVSKPNGHSSIKTRARNLNQGIRGLYLKQQTNVNPEVLIGRSIGRPGWWMTFMVMKALHQMEYEVYGTEYVEADTTIAQLALQQATGKCFVVGSDLDLLALTHGVQGMITPQNRITGML
jgi:hypothetical protein